MFFESTQILMSTSELEKSMRCPLSGKYLTDPVIITVSGQDKLLLGFSYDREEVCRLLSNGVDSVTRYVNNPHLQKVVAAAVANGFEDFPPPSKRIARVPNTIKP